MAARQRKKVTRRRTTLKKRNPVTRKRAKTTRRKIRTVRKRVTRKATRPKAKKVKSKAKRGKPKKVIKLKQATEKEIGNISHYYTHIGVGVIELAKSGVRVGDKIRVRGETTNFTQTIKSLQLGHQKVARANAGQSVGLKVSKRVREHDRVYLVK